MHPILQGSFLGLTLAVLLGPALFSLLQTSIHRGVKSGLFLALGIFISDLTVVALAYLGFLQVISQKGNNSLIAGILGGIILIIFGIFNFRRMVTAEEKEDSLKLRGPGFMTFLLKGYFLNLLNPFVWIIWLTAMVKVGDDFGNDSKGVMLFFFGTLTTILGTDILKVVIAKTIKKYLKPRIVTGINHVVGALLIGFGLFLIIRTILHF